MEVRIDGIPVPYYMEGSKAAMDVLAKSKLVAFMTDQYEGKQRPPDGFNYLVPHATSLTITRSVRPEKYSIEELEAAAIAEKLRDEGRGGAPSSSSAEVAGPRWTRSTRHRQ